MKKGQYSFLLLLMGVLLIVVSQLLVSWNMDAAARRNDLGTGASIIRHSIRAQCLNAGVAFLVAGALSLWKSPKRVGLRLAALGVLPGVGLLSLALLPLLNVRALYADMASGGVTDPITAPQVYASFILTGACFLAFMILWWTPRKVPGHCDCGYNLKGNVSGRCPECGRLITCAA